MFRTSRYWNEQCEQVILGYRKYIDGMYNKHPQKKVNPGQKKFMCLDEAIEICKLSELFFKSPVQEADICQSFNLAMMT